MAEIKDTPEKYPWLSRKLLFLDDKKNVVRVVYTVYGVCAFLFVLDFLYTKKTYLAAENISGFYAIYGFVMCALLVISAKMMRVFLKRDEDYYAPRDVESEDHPEADLDLSLIHI